MDVFHAILQQVVDIRPQEIPILSVLQHLLQIDPKKAVSDVVWGTAETLVHRASSRLPASPIAACDTATVVLSTISVQTPLPPISPLSYLSIPPTPSQISVLQNTRVFWCILTRQVVPIRQKNPSSRTTTSSSWIQIIVLLSLSIVSLRLLYYPTGCGRCFLRCSEKNMINFKYE